MALVVVGGGAAAVGDPSATPGAVAWPADGAYRVGDYRAPVPSTVPGGVTLDTAEAFALFQRGGGLFVDVLPAPHKPEDFPPGRLWLPKPHRNIPGSVWLPDIGHGRLAPETASYLEAALDGVIGRDTQRPLVIYCRADCWMSWNAVKRLALLGYRRVYWYPDGTDGWQLAGHTLAVSKPWAAPAAPKRD